MEILFQNTFIKTKALIKECNKFVLFRRSKNVLTHCAMLSLFLWSCYEWVFLNILNTFGLVFPIIWVGFIGMLYGRLNRISLNRMQELGNENVKIVYEFTKECIRLVNGDSSRNIDYGTIKKCYLTKNYIFLYSKTAHLFHVLSRDGYTIGNEERLLNFLKQKGIKIA